MEATSHPDRHNTSWMTSEPALRQIRCPERNDGVPSHHLHIIDALSSCKQTGSFLFWLTTRAGGKERVRHQAEKDDKKTSYIFLLHTTFANF